MPTPHHPPAAVRRALRKLGADIHDARRRRRLPMAVVAERAFTSRSTLQKIEAGDTNVSIGSMFSVFLLSAAAATLGGLDSPGGAVIGGHDILIMAPGPINRGVELTPEVADGPHSVILKQVTNGISIRMAVLWLLLGKRAAR